MFNFVLPSWVVCECVECRVTIACSTSIHWQPQPAFSWPPGLLAPSLRPPPSAPSPPGHFKACHSLGSCLDYITQLLMVSKCSITLPAHPSEAPSPGQARPGHRINVVIAVTWRLRDMLTRDKCGACVWVFCVLRSACVFHSVILYYSQRRVAGGAVVLVRWEDWPGQPVTFCNLLMSFSPNWLRENTGWWHHRKSSWTLARSPQIQWPPHNRRRPK